MIVAGLDPGSRWVAWTTLDVDGDLARFVSTETIEIDAARPEHVRNVVRVLRRRAPELVGVERVERVNARPGMGSTMATGLLLAHGLGQRCGQAFEDDRRRVVDVTAEQWHEHFFDARAVAGAAIKALIVGRVTGWPKLSNEHERDAAAIALYAASRAA